MNTGYVRQLAKSYYNELTVRENLIFSMSMQAQKGMKLSQKLERVEQVIRETGLVEQADIKVGDGIGLGLSGGQVGWDGNGTLCKWDSVSTGGNGNGTGMRCSGAHMGLGLTGEPGMGLRAAFWVGFHVASSARISEMPRATQLLLYPSPSLVLYIPTVWRLFICCEVEMRQ